MWSRKLLAACGMLFAASCGDGGVGVDDGEPVAAIRIAPPTVTVGPGETAQLAALVLNGDGEALSGVPVEWRSSAPAVATVSSTGLVTGVGPGAATVTAAAGGEEGTADVSVVAAVLDVATAALPPGVVGSAYAFSLEASGGVPPYRWDLSGGTPAPGLDLSEDGRLSGTPSSAGSWTFTVRASSADGQTALAELGLIVAEPLTLLSATLPAAEVGVPYSIRLDATGGAPPYTWSHLDGQLPQGLTLSPDGSVSGTPTRVGAFRLSVRVRSADGQAAEGGIEVPVVGDPLPLRISTETLPDATVGHPYSVALEATGGAGQLLWSVEEGALPPGLELADVGTVLGVPSVPDTVAVTVRVAGELASDTRTFIVRVAADTLLDVSTSVLPPARVGQPYAATLEASGGEPPYTWRLASGFVPSGLRLGSNGTVGGVPLQPGEAAFTVEVSSSDGQVAQGALVLDVESLQDTSPEGYDITVLAVAGISSQLRPHVTSAVARWERVVVGDLDDVTIPGNAFGPTACGGFGNDLNGLDVEDMAVLVNIAPIDGPGRVLGRAGPCGVRQNGLPFAGVLTLDSDDLEPLVGTRTLTDLIFHEIGHVVGIGTLWDDFRLVEGAGGSDPRYLGAVGIEEYAALGGAAPNIPLANTGGSGTRDSHWREDTFRAEIMTGYSEPVGTAMPLSTMTIGSLVDLGYAVDLSEADPYTLPDPAASRPAPPLAGRARDIAWRGPLVVVWTDGSVGRVEEGRR